MLSVRNAVPADATAREVGHRRNVTGGPGTLDDLILAADAKVGAGTDAATFLDGQVAAPHDCRVCHDTGGPDDQIARDDLPGGELDVAADRSGDLRVEVDCCTALTE